MKEVVSLKNVSFRYDDVLVLENVNLSIKDKDFIGLIGPNGGGKTTLLNVILGFLKPCRGEVKVLGMPPRETRSKIGYVAQKMPFERYFPISVWDVVLMGCLSTKKIFSYYDKEDKKSAEEALKRVGMLDSAAKQIGRLSEGQRQRVFIARALTVKPEILLLDEPTSSIDLCVEQSIYELLSELKKTLAVVLVSHDIGVISKYVDKIACLNRRLYYHDSKQIEVGDLQAVYQCPVDMIAHGFPHRVMEEHKRDD
ncbi:MAG: ATP-binding cassette domain-containing protein [Candidatus Omnitrophica bacterium]|nr:ATP-binding cassette domain-containing protein [Candidatus Omnitrophota bacterium]MBD3268806.1 ATP-binding cassette domain-containing protein [Candidatus Omnitrophota bacterium]